MFILIQIDYFPTFKITQFNQQMQLSLSKENIVKCLNCILNNEFLRQSQQYLNRCQSHKNFPIILLEIVEQLEQSALRLQTFLLFVNVIKRNWSSKRSVCIVNLDQQKKFFRNVLIKYYHMNFPYPQVLDNITQFISKIDYPYEWNELHSYFMELLIEMTSNSNYLYNQKMLRGLSIIKNVLKQQSKKRSFTHQKIFQQYTSKYTTYILSLFENMNFRFNTAVVNNATLPIIELKISRNIDRNILYILLTMNADLQDNEEIAVIVSNFLSKIEIIFKALTLATGQVKEFLQKYLKTNLKNLGSIQAAYPFLLKKILNNYIRLHINLLQYNKYFKNTYLLKTIIINLSKIISTIHYNSDEQKFKNTVIGKISSKPNFFLNNKICYQQFIQCFSQTTIQQIFQMIILQIFNYKQQGGEQIIQEQQGTQTTEIQNSIHVLGSQLLYQIIFRFQSVSIVLIKHLLNQMIETNFSNVSSQIENNIYLMLLVLPKIFRTEQLPFQIILKILEHLMISKNHQKMFSIIVSRYFKIFNNEQLQNIFNYLVKICSNPEYSVITKYQTIVTIKKIISESTDNLDISSLSSILIVLVEMYDKFENPTLVWNIVNLTNKIIEIVDFDQNIVSNFLNSNSLFNLVKTRNEILIPPICLLLENIIVNTSKKEAILLVFQFIRRNSQMNIDSKQVLYNLLLTAAQSYQSKQSNKIIEQQFLNLLQVSSEQIKDDYPCIYIQLLQQYLLMGIIKPTNESIQNIIDEIYTQYQDDLIIKTSCLQLYLTLMSIRPIQYNKKIIILIFQSLRQITDVIKIDINNLRTNIITIINYYLIQNAAAFIQNTCSLLNFTKDQLQELWLRNTEFLSTKIAFKINSLAMLVMLDIINFNSLDLYFQTIIKVIMIQLQPIEQSRIQSGKKGKGSIRKYALKKSNRYLQNDFRPLFREKILAIKQKYNLQDYFIIQRISSPSLLDKITSIMNNQV